MLENLRRKSLTKTYNDLTHQVHFESGLARYENHAEIDICTQRLSKDLQNSSFPRVIDTISSDTRVWLRFNMIACPSGTFTMGHEDQENNQPRIETIDTPFLLGETEITQELYEKVMGTNRSEFKHPQNPVENVSWENAIKFCNKLSRLQGLDQYYTENPKSLDYGWNYDSSKNGYRLPTEKEWEYAAKAGTENRWAGTDDVGKLEEYAWFKGNSNRSTHPIATKKPNEWGFYDMSGNVKEWCWDKYNPKNGDASALRVYRGGSWRSNDSDLRSASRGLNSPGSRDDDLGFRVCRSIIS